MRIDSHPHQHGKASKGSAMTRSTDPQGLVPTYETMQTSEQRLRTIIEHHADAIIVNCNGIVRFVNPAAEHLFGRSRAELLDNDLGMPFVIHDKAEVDIIDKYGAHHIAEMRVVDIEWEGDQASLASFRDITSHRRLEEELERRVAERTHQLHCELAERQRIEQTLMHRDSILEAIAFASQRFLTTSQMTRDLPTVIAQLGIATSVNRVVVYTIQPQETDASPSPPRLVVVSEWNAPHTDDSDPSRAACSAPHPAPPTLPPRWHERLLQGRIIHGDRRMFPSHEHAMLDHIASLLIVPIFVGSALWGYIEFDDCFTERQWSLIESEALQTAASILGNALHRDSIYSALLASEDRFRTITDFTCDWVYWMDTSGHYYYISPSCERITGYSPDDFYTTPGLLENLIHPDDRAHFAAHCQTRKTCGAENEERFRMYTRSGEERWIGHVCQTVQTPEGEPTGWRVSNRDITAQVRAEQALKREQQLFMRGPVIVFQWRIKPHWRVDYVSPNITQFGYQAEELTSGRIPYERLIHPDDRARVANEIHTYQQAGVAHFEQDYRILQNNGQERWVAVYMQTVRNAHNRITHYDGYMLDTTERKRSEKLLRNSEERFREFVEGTAELVCQMDASWNMTYVNHTAERIYGLRREECIGKTLFDFIHPTDRGRTRMTFEGWVQRHICSATFENRVVTRKGDEHYMLWTITLHYDEDGYPTTINAIARDITERRRIEQTLRENETRYQAISELMSDFAYALTVEPDGTLTLQWATDAFFRTTGYVPNELHYPGGWETIIHPDDQAMVRQHMHWLMAGQASDTCTFRVVTREHQIRWLQTHTRPVWDKTTYHVAAIYGGARDISREKQLEEELQQAREQYNLLANYSDDMIARQTPEGVYLYVSPACRHMLYYAPRELVGQSSYDLIHPDDLAEVHASYHLIRQSITFDMHRYRMRRKDQSYVWVQTTIKTIRSPEQDRIVELITISRDMTDYMATQETTG